MHILRKRMAPRYQRPEGVSSYLLASYRTCGSRHLTTTLVDVQPGAEQRVHSHEPEQVYFIVVGTGQMTVADAKEEVGPGDCVFVPAGSPHGIKNMSEGVLRYFSAAAPSFELSELETLWPLKSEAEEPSATE